MIGVLSVIVILSACFNYTNLSIARSLRRSREVGIRKVVGALRMHVLSQFVVEAVVIALLALVLSFGLFVLFKPFFLSLNDVYTGNAYVGCIGKNDSVFHFVSCSRGHCGRISSGNIFQ